MHEGFINGGGVLNIVRLVYVFRRKQDNCIRTLKRRFYSINSSNFEPVFCENCGEGVFLSKIDRVRGITYCGLSIYSKDV